MKNIIVLSAFVCLCTSVFAQTKGYEKSVEINGEVGLDNINYTFGVSMINGYRFNNYFFIGGGVGYEYLDGLYLSSYEHRSILLGSIHDDDYDIRNLVQVFARTKANFTNTRISPFASFDIGTTIGLSSNDIKMANGLFFEPAIGCDFNINNNQTFYIMVGYNGQHYEYDYFNLTLGNSSEEMIKETAGKLCLHLGLKF
ncbi:MAG: outer membrane beta-barrel protein [Bacteroidales bacterium]|nr:outer membrane beta-barrel protein [Bacteroidales bacterium]